MQPIARRHFGQRGLYSLDPRQVATLKTAKWLPWRYRNHFLGLPWCASSRQRICYPIWHPCLKYLNRNSRFWPFKPILGPWQPWKRPSGNPGGTENFFCSPLVAYNAFRNTRNRFLTKNIKKIRTFFENNNVLLPYVFKITTYYSTTLYFGFWKSV